MNRKLLILLIVVLMAFCMVMQVSAADLTIKSGNIIVLDQGEGMDKMLCKIGKIKAIKMGFNPICVFNSKGSLSIGKGFMVTIKNNAYSFNDGDMIINAGEKPVEVYSVKLYKGEFGTVQKGKLNKHADKITNDFGSETLYSIFIATNRDIKMLSKAEKVLQDGGFKLIETSTALKKDMQGVEIHYVNDAEAQAKEISKLFEKKLGFHPKLEIMKLISDDDIVIWIGK